MKALVLSCLCFMSAMALAEEECWRKEIDPATRRIYQNAAQWEADKKVLVAKYPPMPNLFNLQKGYRVGLEESRKAARMRPDKRQHCYVGCRIANEAGHDVAVYAAIYKEDKDINDCNPRTHYDLKDIDATIAGADIARGAPGLADGKFCNTKCAAFR
jgi:hypothetical protein